MTNKAMIEYGQTLEVSYQQYHVLMKILSGCIAGRSEDGKYFIQVWLDKKYRTYPFYETLSSLCI